MKFNLRQIRLGASPRERTAEARYVPSNLSTSRPGLLIVLIDQSSSMGRRWGKSSRLRKDVAAEYVNRMIDRVLQDSQVGDRFAPRIWVAIFGYSTVRDDRTYENAFRPIDHGWPEDFAQKEGDWVKPHADGGTLMSLAFQGARQYLEQFFADDPGCREKYAESAPAVILNITDGEAAEFASGDWKDLAREVERVWSLPMPNGFAPLVFHAHISDRQESCVMFPASDEKLDRFGKELFKLASAIPESWILNSGEQFDPPILPGALGLITNAGPEELMKFLTLSSRPK